MKRYSALCLAALMTLSLSACGSTTGLTSASLTAAPTNHPETSSTPAASRPQMPTVTLSKEAGCYRSNDGKVVLLNSEWNTAAVSIPGNEDAQSAVQSDLDQILETFQSISQESRQEAEDLYQADESLADNSAYQTLYHALNITRARCDNAVISLVLDETGYTGGAHSFDARYARNYDTATGQVLSLADLGDSVGDVARDTIVSFINQIHDRDGLFFNKVTQSDLKDLVTDNLFYFDRNGLVFIAGQYSFQSYAEGIVEFTISYDDLKGALKDAYNPGGGVTQCATDLGIYTFHKDGTLDTSRVYNSESVS